MQGPFLRKYGTATTVTFTLYKLDGTGLKTDAAHASGDTKLLKDEASEANTTNGFTDEGQTYAIALTATEMQAARIVLIVVDQSNPQVWLDTTIVIETYGHASAQHPFDLGTTSTPQTGDSYARLGAPAGASIAADIAAIEAQTDDIGAAGAGLTALPWNAAWDAEVQSECADALAAYDPPTNAEMVARTLTAANYATAAKQADIEADTQDLQTQIGTDGAGLTALPWNAAWDAEVQSECADALAAYDPPTNAEMIARTLAAANYATAAALYNLDEYIAEKTPEIIAVTDKLDTALELDGAVYRLTENALEQAPSGSGLDAAGVRAAIGMASADLDTQLDAIAGQISGISAGAGAGAIAHTITVQHGGQPVIAADVWCTTGANPNTGIVASGETNGDGQVTFYLDAGTYYLWAQKPGVNFTNPTEIEVTG